MACTYVAISWPTSFEARPMKPYVRPCSVYCGMYKEASSIDWSIITSYDDITIEVDKNHVRCLEHAKVYAQWVHPEGIPLHGIPY